MPGRRDRRGGRVAVRIPYVDPAVALLADYAWRAEDVSTSGGNVTAWNPFRGSSTLSTLVGTAPTTPTAKAALNNKLAVNYLGNGHLGGDLTPTGTSQTWVFIGTCTTDFATMFALTNAGTAHTGTSAFSVSDTPDARRPGPVDVAFGGNPGRTGVWLFEYTTAGAAIYKNSTTPLASGASASAAFNFQRFYLGGTSSNTSDYPSFIGGIALCAGWNRVLSGAEKTRALSTWCSTYGQVFTP